MTKKEKQLSREQLENAHKAAINSVEAAFYYGQLISLGKDPDIGNALKQITECEQRLSHALAWPIIKHIGQENRKHKTDPVRLDGMTFDICHVVGFYLFKKIRAWDVRPNLLAHFENNIDLELALAIKSLNGRPNTNGNSTAHARAKRSEKLRPRNKRIVKEWQKRMRGKRKSQRTQVARHVGKSQKPPLSEDQITRILKDANVWSAPILGMICCLQSADISTKKARNIDTDVTS